MGSLRPSGDFLCCANKMDPAFFPHESHTRHNGWCCARNPHSSSERREGLLCTSQHWGSMWQRMCFSCTGWMREGVRCLARNRSEMYDSVSMGVSLWFWQRHSSGLPDSGRSCTSAKVETCRSLLTESVRASLKLPHNIYRLTPSLIAPRVMVSGVKPRWLSYPSRFLTILSVTDSPVSAAFTSPSL